MSNFIPVFEPLLDGNEKLYVEECFKNGWIAQNGPFTKKLEEEFSKYGTCVANGSAALDLAVRAMKEVYNWEDNSEILVPSFNIISAAQSCLYSNLQPVFVDAEAETWNIDVSKIEQHITEKTRAIVVVHIYGLPSKMNEIIEIAKKYDLKIIEDAAQAHGQTYNNRICGSFGDITAFSFFINKNVACGEGGIVLASDERLIEKVKYYKNLCFGSDKFVHHDLGWNYRMTDIQAAIAYAQFEKLDKTIEKKKYIGNFYRNLLKDIPAKISLETSFNLSVNFCTILNLGSTIIVKIPITTSKITTATAVTILHSQLLLSILVIAQIAVTGALINNCKPNPTNISTCVISFVVLVIKLLVENSFTSLIDISSTFLKSLPLSSLENPADNKAIK